MMYYNSVLWSSTLSISLWNYDKMGIPLESSMCTPICRQGGKTIYLFSQFYLLNSGGLNGEL